MAYLATALAYQYTRSERSEVDRVWLRIGLAILLLSLSSDVRDVKIGIILAIHCRQMHATFYDTDLRHHEKMKVD